MANCVVCGEKLGLLGGVVVHDSGDVVVQTCEKCQRLYKDIIAPRINGFIKEGLSPEEIGKYMSKEFGGELSKTAILLAKDYYKKNAIKIDSDRETEYKEELRRLTEMRSTVVDAQREALKAKGADGYWEYKAIKISDNLMGGVNMFKLTNMLNAMGSEGWKLRVAYTNELGQNALGAAAGAVGIGLNSTSEEHIMIFERFVKY